MARNSYFIISKDLAADKTLSATGKLLFGQLLEHLNRKTGRCNPWESTLADELGVSRRTVIRQIAALEKAGWIGVKRRPTHANRYEFPKCQNVTWLSDKMAPVECQNATSEAPVSLYEPNPNEPKAAADSEVEIDRAAAAPKTNAKPTQKPPARATNPSGFRLVRETLNEMAPLAGLPLPDDDLVRRVIEAANGASGQEIQDALVLMWKRGALRVMRSWGFIPIKIQDLARKAATA